MDSIHNELKALEHMLDGNEKPSNLSLSVLKYITDNFSEERKIGDGGCGEVYKGILLNRTTVAVKKLFINKHTIDDKQFIQEVQSMMMIEHQNIVRFIGYCSHTEQKAVDIKGKYVMADIPERLLCFEYINNGSLDNYLTDELRGFDWCTRYKIIKGICEGLHHLHKEKHIIHMDLKPSNILLDDHMVPKIADFGLSRLGDISHTSNNYRLLSPRYCAPEYQHHGKMSLRSDIYSLGVIIIELVTGSKEEPDTTNVLRRWKHRWNKSSEHTLWEYKQVTKCIELALRCMDKDPLERPFIWDMIDALNHAENENSNERTADQIMSYLEDMLGIEPLELHFPFEPNKQISCSLQLTNDTYDYFAFRIEAMNPLQYCMDPIEDIVPPQSKYSVTVTTQTREQAPKRKPCKEELNVQSTRVDKSLTTMGIITKDLFSEKTKKVIDKVNLSIIFDMLPLPEEPKKDLSVMPRLMLNEVSPEYQGAGKASDDLQLSASNVETSYQLPSCETLGIPKHAPTPVPQHPRIPKHDEGASSAAQPQRLRILKHDEEASPTPQPQDPSILKRDEEAPPAPQPQHPLSPMGEASSRMDLMAMHQILKDTGYRDDPPHELSFKEWTDQMRSAFGARRDGDNAFCAERFKDAMEHYREAIGVMPTFSPTTYARQSLCHLKCDQPDAALRDAMQAELLHPGWPTALYLQAVALSELNMQSDAMNMLNEAFKLEKRQETDKERREKEEEESRLREEKWRAINEECQAKEEGYCKTNQFRPSVA